MSKIKAFEHLRGLFEERHVPSEKCDKCGNTTDERNWYCFKQEAISEDRDGYRELSDIIHGSNVGEDYAYNWIVNFLDYLIDNDIEDVSEAIHEFADSEADCYTSDLTRWLNASAYNPSYISEAVSEFGETDNLLGVAQMMAIREVVGRLEDVIDDVEIKLVEDDEQEDMAPSIITITNDKAKEGQDD